MRISEEAGKADVMALMSDGTTWLHDQIKRKTDVFQASTDPQKYFHPLGIAYTEKGRLHYKRLDKLDDVPKGIRDSFTLVRYEEVAPTPLSKALKGKLVVMVDKGKPKEMARLFVLEKIRPVFPETSLEILKEK